MNDFLSLYWTDSYKVGHKFMLPEGSVLMQSGLTPRSDKRVNVPSLGGMVTVGARMVWTKIVEDWDMNFFRRPEEDIVQFGKDMEKHLMIEHFDISHYLELHQLGFLPLQVKTLPEGTLVPYGVPMTVVVNTRPLRNYTFDWLVNYLETIHSAESWMMPTSATTALAFRKLGAAALRETDPDNMWLLDYMFHDFSERGMAGRDAIVSSGLGFAFVSSGSDVLPVIPASRKYYGVGKDEVVINSVVATEHAIMCTLTGFYIRTNKGSWEKYGTMELETFRELLKRFPTGILSVVSDTWDIWKVLTEYMVELRDDILQRDGKVVVRPDSGDPVDIICGHIHEPLRGGMADATMDIQSPVYKGVVELLWDCFGGTTNKLGYKVLNPHIGCIYGDAITFDRAKEIFARLKEKSFAASNVVFGVGSYTLQHVTRDTHGIAQKATYVEVEIDGKVEGIEIFKDPVTDGGVKKSARGLLRVNKDENGKYVLQDRCSKEEFEGGELRVLFEDGWFSNLDNFHTIRERIRSLV